MILRHARGCVPTRSRGRLAQGCALTELPHRHRLGTVLVCFSPYDLLSPRHQIGSLWESWIVLSIFPFWKHVFTQMSCKDFFFPSFYLLLDLCVDGPVASNSNDIQSCASALQTWEKMSLCLNEIIIFEGNSKH